MKLNAYLSVFNLVRETGQKHGDKYVLDDLTVWSDFDGYTCYLSFADLTMTLFFHGKYSFDYQKSSTLDTFQALITRLHHQKKQVIH